MSMNKTCCVCGNGCQGEQWWNRDTDYGLCPACAIWLKEERKVSAEEMEDLYGKPGIHYQVPLSFLPGALQNQARRVIYETEDMSQKLYEALFDSPLAKGMPYGTQKARTGDPVNWLTSKLVEVLRA